MVGQDARAMLSACFLRMGLSTSHAHNLIPVSPMKPQPTQSPPPLSGRSLDSKFLTQVLPSLEGGGWLLAVSQLCCVDEAPVSVLVISVSH
jgi:hypothetical protein